MSNETNKTNNAEMTKAAEAGGDDAISKLNEALSIAVASEESPTDGDDRQGYKRYDLSTAIDNFAAVMEQNADRLTDAHKQVIANLTGRPFCSVKPTKRVYSTSVIPYFRGSKSSFTHEMLAALDEFCIAHDITHCKGIHKRDRYALSKKEMTEIVMVFREAEEGRFAKPTWCPAYIDDIDKMKAFVFAFMTDINYHSERRLLEKKGPSAFAHIADMWDNDYLSVAIKEQELLGH